MIIMSKVSITKRKWDSTKISYKNCITEISLNIKKKKTWISKTIFLKVKYIFYFS